MRRNAPQRRITGMSSGAPLLTEHLRNLDMELDLLKRKREMIEQQQLYSLQEQFESFKSYTPQFSSKRDFSSLYSDTIDHGNQHSRKRHAGPVWEHEVQATVAAGPKNDILPLFGGSSSRLGSRSGYQGSTSVFGSGPARYQSLQASHKPGKSPAPLMSVSTSLGAKLRRQLPNKLAQKNLTKVMKPKPQPPPNRLASQPVARRANLVAEATKSSAKDNAAPVLRKDQVPTQQMTGRLEWALGAIMKDIKEKYSENKNYSFIFTSMQMQRLMKQTIRERIRSIMLGQVINSSPEIKEKYRRKYPEATDIDLLKIALDSTGIGSEEKSQIAKKESAYNPPSYPKIRSVTNDLPEDADLYFRVNMNNLLSVKLDEIFKRLKEVYEKEQTDRAASQKPTPDITKDKLIQEMKTEQNDGEPNQEVATRDQKDAEQDQKDENQDEKDTSQDENDTNQHLGDATTSVQEATKIDQGEKNVVPKRLTSAEISRIITIKRMLPRLLRKHTVDILQILDADEEYSATKAEIIAKAEEINAKNKEAAQQIAAEKQAQADETPKPTFNINYFVRIKAQPFLPKKHLMRDFLNKFNTKSIKKHRGVHNLLFVGFSEKSDYDNIIAANGTSIGHIVLEITSNESRNIPKKSTEDENNKVNDSVASSELDGHTDDSKVNEDCNDDENVSHEQQNEEFENTEEVDTSAVIIVEGNESSEIVDLTEYATQEDNVEEIEENSAETNEETVDCNVEEVDKNSAETNDEMVTNDVSEDVNEESSEKSDNVMALKDPKEGQTAIPTRVTRSATATPSTIGTRRTSRFLQN